MNKKIEITKNNFVKAFCILAQDRSINEITVTEVTKKAGYNRTTFYHYFTDLYSVQEYMEDTFINQCIATIHSKMVNNNVASVFPNLLITVCQQNRDQLLILLSNQNRINFINKLKAVILKVMSTNFTKDHDHNDITLDIYLTGIFSAIYSWLKRPDDVNTKELKIIITHLFQRWYWPEMTSTTISK